VSLLACIAAVGLNFEGRSGEFLTWAHFLRRDYNRGMFSILRYHALFLRVGVIFLAFILARCSSVVVLAQPVGASNDSPASFAELSARANAARDADRMVDAERLYKRALALRPQWTEG
jgi:hypothetical protein